MARSSAPATLAIALLLLLVPAAASAYIDPSAGSMFLQLLLGGVAGLMVALKLTYRRILGRLGRRTPEPAEDSDGEPPR